MPKSKSKYQLTIQWDERLRGSIEIKAQSKKEAKQLFEQDTSQYLENMEILGHALPYDMYNIRIDDINKE